MAASHVWLTPPEIVGALGPFDLDPCAAPGWPLARVQVFEPDDGLAYEWFGCVRPNPPYGKHTAAWLEKLARHGSGIALVFARTETQMFAKHVWPRANAILFLEGRPHFHHPDGRRAEKNCGGPMCLIAYGPCNAVRLRDSGIKGAFLCPQG